MDRDTVFGTVIDFDAISDATIDVDTVSVSVFRATPSK